MNFRHLSTVLFAAALGGAPAQAQRMPITTTSDDARAHFVMGRDAAHHYQFAEAREHLDAAIAADPTFVLAHLHRGGSADFVSEIRDYLARAAAHRDRASPGEQQMIDAFTAFLLHDDYTRAIEIFSRLSAQFPDDPYLPSYLGLRYYRNLRRYDEAVAQFQRALERDSSFTQAYNWLGHIAMDQGQLERAEETFNRYVRLAPNQPRAYNSLGMFHLRQRRYEDAARMFEQASARDPRFTESRDNLLLAQIAPVIEQFEAAFARRDTAALAALYTASARLVGAGSGVLAGSGSIARHWQSVVGRGSTAADLETLEMHAGAADGIATEVGRYRIAAGESEADAGMYVAVWLKTPDGWKRHRDVWTSTRAASAPAR